MDIVIRVPAWLDSNTIQVMQQLLEYVAASMISAWVHGGLKNNE